MPDDYRCLRCGKVGMTEDEFVAHECPEPEDTDADAEDARWDAYWNAEAERQRPPGE